MTAPKKPQDHQQKAAPDEKPEGWELLKPAGQMKPRDTAVLVALVIPLQHLKDNAEMTPAQIMAMGDLAEQVEQHVTDPEAYAALTNGGVSGLNKAVALAAWFAGQLGESERSAS